MYIFSIANVRTGVAWYYVFDTPERIDRSKYLLIVGYGERPEDSR